MQLVGFNARQVRQGICQRGATKRQAERVSEHRKAAAFGVRELQATAAEMSFEDAIFLKQIGHHLLLMPLQPAGDHGDEYMEDHGVPQVKSRAARVRSSIRSI
jgi:hypothetical protein